MKFENINKKFTEKVNEYISRGYYINAGTMSCSGGQGEISHIDLTNGKEMSEALALRLEDVQIQDQISLVRLAAAFGIIGSKLLKQ